MATIGFSYIGLLFLLMLTIPNLIWTKKQPQGYDPGNENKILLLLERIGQVAVTTIALFTNSLNPKRLDRWLIWLVVAFGIMVLYELWWLKYFKSPKGLADFYSSFLGVPVAGATLPVIAFFLLGIYGKSLPLIIAITILGIGHIGIHLEHKRSIGTILALLIVSSVLTGCSQAAAKPLTRTELLFDTVISIQLYDQEAKDILDECFTRCQTYEQKFSRTISGSEIDQINHAGGQPVTVSEETFTLIERGIHYGNLSAGNFDITTAPLSNLWDFSGNNKTVPDPQAIAAAAAHVNYQNIILDPEQQSVQLTDPKAALDLGGIAKGYIADQIKDYLLSKQIEHALINLGGNILVIGGKPDGSAYNIGIQKPFGEKNEALTTVQESDRSVVTSGIYERYFETDGVLYHHIMNPETGIPCDTDLAGVTILSDSSMDGDALSTICLSLGLEKGMAFIATQENTDAIFITKDNAIHYSN